MTLTRGTHRGGKFQPTCAVGCLGFLVVAALWFAGVVAALPAAGMLAGAIALDCALGWLFMRRDRRVVLDRAAQELRDEYRTVFGPRVTSTSFGALEVVRYEIDHDHDETEYKVKLGRPSVFKVCEIKDNYADSLVVAETVAEFTGLRLVVTEEDAHRHAIQARKHRERVEAHQRDSDAAR